MMHYLKKTFSVLFVGTIAFNLNSCASSLANAKSNVSLPNSEITDAPVHLQLDSRSLELDKKTQEIPTANQPPKASSQTAKTISINLYQVDNQCQGLVSNKITIAANNSVDQVVEKVLTQVDSADLNLAGYRVKIDKNKIATVDLRLPPKSKRLFSSLSNCEQLALFGSLRKTLSSNPQLNIKDVRFTNQGTKISY